MGREHLDQEQRDLQNSVLQLGSMVEKMIGRSIRSLVTRDVALATQVKAEDSQVDAVAYSVEAQALSLIATQQPVAIDMRRVAAALVISLELERIGDHAEGIAKLAIKLADEPPLKPLIDIPRMGEHAAEMLHQALQAYAERDEAHARRVWEMDDFIDDLYDQVYRELLTYMMSDPHTINRATNLLHIAHDLERIGDRVTNICERVVYIVTGAMTYVHRPAAVADVSADR